jgi:hypothetical protein
MDFIKKHYEKLVLGVVLLAVAGVAISLVLAVSQVKADLETALAQAAGAKQKSLQPVNLVTNEMELARVVKHMPVVLGDPDHYTFNPVTWARAANGRIEPTRGRADMGAAGLAYVESHDLYLEIGFSAVAGTPETPRYQFSIRRDYEKTPKLRTPIVESVAVGAESKDQIFKLLEIKGPKEDPTDFICELVSTREQFTISKTKTFRKTQGYSADLRYEANKQSFNTKRVGDSLNLSGAVYKIVAIEKDELVVSAPNSVRTTVLRASAQ